jgi:hypothetical protein
MSVELVQEETKRIKQERLQAKKILAACAAEYDQIALALDAALKMVVNCHEAYVSAKPVGKRQLNQAIFDKLYVTPDGIVAADLAEPFAQLLTTDLDQRLEAERASTPEKADDGRVYLREDEEARVRQLLASVN